MFLFCQQPLSISLMCVARLSSKVLVQALPRLFPPETSSPGIWVLLLGIFRETTICHKKYDRALDHKFCDLWFVILWKSVEILTKNLRKILLLDKSPKFVTKFVKNLLLDTANWKISNHHQTCSFDEERITKSVWTKG